MKRKFVLFSNILCKGFFFPVLCQWYRRRCLSVASWTRKQFHQTNYGMFLKLDICMHTCLIPVLPQIWYSYFKTIQSIKSLMYINIDVYQCFFPIRNNFECGLSKHELYFTVLSLTESAMSQQDDQWLQLHRILQPHRYSGTLLREQKCLSVGHAATPKECLCAL